MHTIGTGRCRTHWHRRSAAAVRRCCRRCGGCCGGRRCRWVMRLGRGGGGFRRCCCWCWLSSITSCCWRCDLHVCLLAPAAVVAGWMICYRLSSIIGARSRIRRCCSIFDCSSSRAWRLLLLLLLLGCNFAQMDAALVIAAAAGGCRRTGRCCAHFDTDWLVCLLLYWRLELVS